MGNGRKCGNIGLSIIIILAQWSRNAPPSVLSVILHMGGSRPPPPSPLPVLAVMLIKGCGHQNSSSALPSLYFQIHLCRGIGSLVKGVGGKPGCGRI